MDGCECYNCLQFTTQIRTVNPSGVLSVSTDFAIFCNEAIYAQRQIYWIARTERILSCVNLFPCWSYRPSTKLYARFFPFCPDAPPLPRVLLASRKLCLSRPVRFALPASPCRTSARWWALSTRPPVACANSARLWRAALRRTSAVGGCPARRHPQPDTAFPAADVPPRHAASGRSRRRCTFARSTRCSGRSVLQPPVHWPRIAPALEQTAKSVWQFQPQRPCAGTIAGGGFKKSG